MKCASTFEMLTATFSESAMSRIQFQLWYNRFKEGREDVNDEARSGRPSTLTTNENIEAVKNMIREVADDVDISFGSCKVIFTDVLGRIVENPIVDFTP